MAEILAGKAWEISTMSVEEYAELSATLHTMGNDAFKCEMCLTRYKEDEDGRRRAEHHRKYRLGCFGGDGNKVFVRLGSVAFHTCPGNYWSNESAGWIELWKVWTNQSVLPFAGAIVDQPAKIMEVFAALNALSAAERKNREPEKTGGKELDGGRE